MHEFGPFFRVTDHFIQEIKCSVIHYIVIHDCGWHQFGVFLQDFKGCLPFGTRGRGVDYADDPVIFEVGFTYGLPLFLIDVRKSAPFKEGDVAVGYKMKIKVVKNKIGIPFKETTVDVIYGVGVDKIKDLVDFGASKGVLTKAGGGWISYGDTKLGQGSDKVAALLNDNPEFLGEITAKLLG